MIRQKRTTREHAKLVIEALVLVAVVATIAKFTLWIWGV
jgi:hypothetical protein